MQQNFCKWTIKCKASLKALWYCDFMGSQFKNEIFILFVSNSRNEFILRGEEYFFFSDAGEFLIGGNFKNKRDFGNNSLCDCM